MECRLFPRHPYELGYHEGCGYQFSDAVTGERVVPKAGYAQFTLKSDDNIALMGYEPVGDPDMSREGLRLSDVCIATLYRADGTVERQGSGRQTLKERVLTALRRLRRR